MKDIIDKCILNPILLTLFIDNFINLKISYLMFVHCMDHCTSFESFCEIKRDHCILIFVLGQWYNPAYDDRGPQRFNPDYHRSEPDLGRQINHNRPSTASLPTPQPNQNHDPSQGPPHPPHSQVGPNSTKQWGSNVASL